jgi:hypothetical protein
METHVFKMAANFRDKRTSITTIRAKNRAFVVSLMDCTICRLTMSSLLLL